MMKLTSYILLALLLIVGQPSRASAACTVDTSSGKFVFKGCSSISSDSGTLTIQGNLVVQGNLTVNGGDLKVTGGNIAVNDGRNQGTFDPSPNGKGNVIIGYNEGRTPSQISQLQADGIPNPGDFKTGSHNLIIGAGNN